MTTVNKCIAVPYSAAEVFQLVNDIKSYPQFLPFCTDARILHGTDDQLIASISLKAGKLCLSFTTKNTVETDRKIQMQLIEGPFKWLDGCWEFQAIGPHSCSIILKINFEFNDRIIERVLAGVFSKMIGSMTDAFVARAHQAYGKRLLK